MFLKTVDCNRSMSLKIRTTNFLAIHFLSPQKKLLKS
ncbi:hypothetical protein EMIT0P74_20006 [Pseudomonas sp. IT-P74]